MRGVETRIQEIRHRIFREVARMAYHTPGVPSIVARFFPQYWHLISIPSPFNYVTNSTVLRRLPTYLTIPCHRCNI